MLIPIFQPPEDDSPSRRRAVMMMVAGLLLAAGIGVFVMLSRSFMPGAPMVMAVLIMIALVFGLVVFTYALSARGTPKSKPKRELDMYAVMDRMVADLDDDELAYLQRKLDERRHVKNEALAESVENILDRRDQDRQQ